MSSGITAATLQSVPPSARAMALLLASTPSVVDAPPRVLQQLLEFSYRYTAQVLQEAQVYAEHAGRPGKLTVDDVTLAIQAKVGYEFGGRVPKDYVLSLAASTNSEPLPPVPESFGIRLPPPEHCLIQPEYDLVPNAPPPEDTLYEEFEEEVTDNEPDPAEDEDDGDDFEMEDAPNVNGINGGEGHDEDLFDGEEDEDEAKPATRKMEEEDDYD